MNALTQFVKKLALLFARRRFRSELDEEMAFHQAQTEKEFEASGLNQQEAHYAALRQLGNATRLKEQSHELVAFRAERVAQDIRFAWRQLVRRPGFALTATVVLALGMGASLAIFAFVDAALLEPLPYTQPSHIMSVNESGYGHPRWPLSYPDYLDWQRLNRSFSSLVI